MVSKVCTKCKSSKPETAFYKNNQRKDKLSSHCKICASIYCVKHREANKAKYASYKREYYSKNKEYHSENAKKYNNKNLLAHRNKYLITKYGISLETYNKMLLDQNESCAICKRHKSNFSRNLSVDHNHKTGKVRALLCFTCNKFKVGRHTQESAKDVYEYLLKYDAA